MEVFIKTNISLLPVLLCDLGGILARPWTRPPSARHRMRQPRGTRLIVPKSDCPNRDKLVQAGERPLATGTQMADHSAADDIPITNGRIPARGNRVVPGGEILADQ